MEEVKERDGHIMAIVDNNLQNNIFLCLDTKISIAIAWLTYPEFP